MNTAPKRELRIDIPLAIFLALAPFGYENLDLPHSKAVGFTSGTICLLLLLRVTWIFLFAGRVDVQFKDTAAITWWRRQVIKHDISGMHAYFASLEIPVPEKIPPLTVHEGGQAIFNPPHMYRGDLKKIGRAHV